MEEERNECIKHFSHEHPLRVFELDYLEDPNPKAHRCHICGLPILHSPSYTCSSGNECSFYLHKACAESMAEEIKHDHLHKGILGLERADSDSDSSFMYRCRKHFASDYPWRGGDSCALMLHPLVGNPVEIRSKHMSHESHPLVALCREIVSLCNVCGEEEKGFFFYCQHWECNHWVHQHCTILPRAVKLPGRDDPYILAYSLIEVLILRSWTTYDNCSICNKALSQPKSGVYFNCEGDWSYAHVGCAKSTAINRNDLEFLRLPDEEEERRFPSLTIRRFCSDSDGGAGKKTMRHHGHPLIRVDDADSDVCNVCTQPLQILSYKCHQHDCPFAAHEMCAHNLPTTLHLSIFTLTLVHSSSDQLRACVLCDRPFNGFAYQVDDRLFYYDVECALVPKIINHSSHNQHLLFQNDSLFLSYEQGPAKLNCCSDMTFRQGFYKCVVCHDFCIHVRCALLPQKTRHKFDQHPLHLITTTLPLPLPKTEQHLIFCELCEKPIDLQFWYYGCHHCSQYFHINCIPSVGHLSKINFGHQPNCVLPQHHQHPLNLTRMLTHAFNERCAVCNQLIWGFSDEVKDIALHCEPCHFWIHFLCVLYKTGDDDFPTYRVNYKSSITRLMN